jgi:ribosome-binding protein aMBF1 (putative translation factor)
MGLSGWETDVDMAEDTGIDVHLINGCIRGELPKSLEEARKIAKALDISLVTLALIVKNKEILKWVR